MNEVLQHLSLLAGGSHYPTINPAMQQRFAELIVEAVFDRIESEGHQVSEFVVQRVKQHFLSN